MIIFRESPNNGPEVKIQKKFSTNTLWIGRGKGATPFWKFHISILRQPSNNAAA